MDTDRSKMRLLTVQARCGYGPWQHRLTRTPDGAYYLELTVGQATAYVHGLAGDLEALARNILAQLQGDEEGRDGPCPAAANLVESEADLPA